MGRRLDMRISTRTKLIFKEGQCNNKKIQKYKIVTKSLHNKVYIRPSTLAGRVGKINYTYAGAHAHVHNTLHGTCNLLARPGLNAGWRHSGS